MLAKIIRAKAVSVLCFLSFLFVLGGSLWADLALRGVANAPLILHFNDIDGITSVGSLATIIFIGLLGLAIVIMNFFIALEFDARDRFLGKFTAVLTLIFAILLFIAFAAIINVN